MQRRIKRAVADLQHFARNLSQTLADRPAVERLQRQNFQDQQGQGALNQVRRTAHAVLLSITEISISEAPLGNQEENFLNRYCRESEASTTVVTILPTFFCRSILLKSATSFP